MNIYDIDMKASKDEINSVWDQVRNDTGYNSANLNITTAQSRMSSGLYKIEIETDNNETSVIYTDVRSSDQEAIFKKMSFKSVNGKFYLTTTNDAELLLAKLLEAIAKKTDGTFVAEYGDNNDTVAIIDGKTYPVVPGLYCEAKRKMYAYDKEIDGDPSDSGISFSINKPLSKYISENPDLKDEIKKLSTNEERASYIGKWLMLKKMEGAIDAEEFKDLFMQAGLAGYTDKTCKMLYELLL